MSFSRASFRGRFRGRGRAAFMRPPPSYFYYPPPQPLSVPIRPAPPPPTNGNAPKQGYLETILASCQENISNPFRLALFILGACFVVAWAINASSPGHQVVQHLRGRLSETHATKVKTITDFLTTNHVRFFASGVMLIPFSLLYARQKWLTWALAFLLVIWVAPTYSEWQYVVISLLLFAYYAQKTKENRQTALVILLVGFVAIHFV
ncbi:hypothetical protein [Hubei hepe-like virus 1]|uniref:hypothetical protein n=1 Tax=Hubei hepe-like virus 1 TaxID=1922894 RepID=UPI00090CD950|nr:hypothetical protein [Hubei hepe-like virus 1]APG77751.1 hypothetical protein [Hubei hepe-like virus 1]